MGTRIIAIPLSVVMVAAITTVYLGNGIEAANNGLEIPLYYLLMLFNLMVTCLSKYSVDALIEKRLTKNPCSK